MATDIEPAERSYLYRTSPVFLVGCGVPLFATLGAGGCMLIPLGWDLMRNGDAVGGWTVVVVGAVNAFMLLLATFAAGMAIKDTIAPPRLRLLPSALVLPPQLQGQPATDEKGQPRPDAPRQQPEEIPFSAIRWARREQPGRTGYDRLVIVHDLTPVTLMIEQSMMRPADFDELESVLRAALPGAFAPAPPAQPPPP